MAERDHKSGVRLSKSEYERIEKAMKLINVRAMTDFVRVAAIQRADRILEAQKTGELREHLL